MLGLGNNQGRQPIIGSVQHITDGLSCPLQPRRPLRLLSFNIQVGISTRAYWHYVARSWKHVLPHQERDLNIEKISQMLTAYDLVALQEADGGSLRSRQVNQVQRLAELAKFPYWYQQLNRDLYPFARHSNGLLSRLPIQQLEDHPLPGPSGRGALLATIGIGSERLGVIMMHLALSSKARNRQLAYVRELASDFKHFVLMGDLNTQPEELLLRSPLRDLDLRSPQSCATFPSWKPQRCLDHILVSSELKVGDVCVLPAPISDHLPVSTEIYLPEHPQIAVPEYAGQH